jgi:glutamyl-tRNA synthetase
MADITGPVRVRFAPSPTGYLHIGGVRTALFNYLVARHYGGQFILRVEDTDEKRYVPGAADDMMASLRWAGIDWDEGPDVGGPCVPYVQTQRQEAGIYAPFVARLLASGRAYRSFITEEELNRMRAEAGAAGGKGFRFRSEERSWAAERSDEAAARGTPHTVRLKVPEDGVTSFHDLIRGGDQIAVRNEDLYDIVLVKSDGMPVYHLAHLIDDHLMGITHVIRGEEWVPSTPYHVLIYEALGWELPVFAHVPNILREDGRGKLSKRKDDVATNRFWERGYLPEAMFNYLALQGWSYDDHTEIMAREEIIERFTIARVQASPARWNPDKLRDINGVYIRRTPTPELARRILPFLARAGLVGQPPAPAEVAYVEGMVPLVQERMEELSQAPEALAFFFREVSYPEPGLLIQKNMDAAATLGALRAAQERLALVPAGDWQGESLEATLRAQAAELGLKPGQFFGVLRVAVTGRAVAPPLFGTLAVLGRERTWARLAAAQVALAGVGV